MDKITRVTWRFTRVVEEFSRLIGNTFSIFYWTQVQPIYTRNLLKYLLKCRNKYKNKFELVLDDKENQQNLFAEQTHPLFLRTTLSLISYHFSLYISYVTSSCNHPTTLSLDYLAMIEIIWIYLLTFPTLPLNLVNRYISFPAYF